MEAVIHHHHHGWTFIALSLFVAIFGSWTALDLASRVRVHLGRTQLLWVSTAALAMGLSIWSMHFIAMLGFDLGAPVAYAPGLTALSLCLAIGSTWSAFVAATRPGATWRGAIGAGVAMGAGICAMHYVGMAALRSAVVLTYRPGLVLASLAIAVAASTIGLFIAKQRHAPAARLTGAICLGAAVVGMHYTAMAALDLTPVASPAAAPLGVPPVLLGIGVAAGTLLVLFLATMASLYDQRGNILQALDAGGVGYWEYDFRNQSVHASRQVKALFGLQSHSDLTLDQWLSALSREDQARRELAMEHTLRTGEDHDVEYRLTEQDRWVNVRGKVVHDQRGKPARMIGVVLDVTDRHQAFAAVTDSERRHRLMTNELNHRVKNTLATIQSIANQTARQTGSIAEFRGAFEDRLMALSATHNILTQESWEAVGIEDLVAQQMAPYPAEQISAQGPALRLSARQALALGMILHELTANAAKHGSLSTPAGRLDVRWQVLEAGDMAPLFLLTWRETGGPPVSPPTKTGFGSRLIKASVEQDLAGAIALDYRTKGLVCRIEAPLQAVSDAALRLA